MHTAKKSLGQNFLHSEKALKQIIAAAQIVPGETVIEIGPGTGILTKRLLEAGARVVAIEKDSLLIPKLKETFSDVLAANQLTLVYGDILETPVVDLTPNPYKLIANIPYYITGAILRKFLSEDPRPALAVLMVQKEVGERIMARNKKESLLSLSIKCYGIPRLVAVVPRGAFRPVPGVDSAILSIEKISKDFFGAHGIRGEESFFRLIHAGFAHKRKQLLANLKAAYPLPETELRNLLLQADIDPKTRAEDLPLAKWQSLANLLG